MNAPTMPPGMSGSRTLWMAVFLVCAAAFALLTLWRPLSDPDEGRYAEIPREMVASGNWMEMRLLGFRYYEKPPLAYWCGALSLKLLGIGDSAARLPLIPIAVGVLALAWYLARKYWGRERALASGVVLLTLLGFFVSMAFLLTDNLLVFWFSLACVLLFEGFGPDASSRRQYACMLAATVAVFLGVLTKGLLALVLPAGILFLWLVWERRLQRLWHGSVFLGIALFAALLAPMAHWLELHNPDFIRLFFIEEHFARFTGTRAIQGHPEPLWFYGPVVLLLMLPWTLFLFRAARTSIRARALRSDALTRFLVVWFLVVFVFFSVSSGKLMSYIMPLMIPMGLLLGRWGVAEPLDGSRADLRLWRAGLALLPVMAVGVFGFWMVAYLDLFPEDFAPPLLVSVLPILPSLAALGALAFKPAFRSLAGFCLTLALAYFGFAGFASLSGKYFAGRMNSSAPLYKELTVQLKPDDQVLMMSNYRPSFPFYLDRQIWVYKDRNELKMGIDREPDNEPGHLTDAAELGRMMRKWDGRWFVMMKKEHVGQLDQEGIPYDPAPVAEDLERVILRLTPPADVSRAPMPGASQGGR